MIKITDIVDFNPSRKIARGTKTSFIEMAALPTGGRDVIQIDKKEFKGGGAKFQNGDTLFARITPCLENGKTAKVSNLESDEVAFGSTEFIGMAAIDANYDEDFVYYLARLPEFRQYAASRMEGTSGRQRVAWQSLAEFNFNFPEKELRKTAASSLKVLDDKIAINQRINQTLEAMAQAMFKSWFVDSEPTRAKMAALDAGGAEEDVTLAAMTAISGKSSEALAILKTTNPESYADLHTTASLFPSYLVESELGEIPEGWRSGKIEDVLELPYGKALKKTDRKEGNVPVYGSGGINGYHNEPLVSGPGIIVGRKGTVGSIHWENRGFFPIDTVFYVIPKKGFSLSYSYQLLKIQGLENMNTDAAVPGLNRNNVYRLGVTLPSLEVISAFNKAVDLLYDRVSILTEETDTLTQLRDSLLPKLLSGEISVDAAASQTTEAV